MSVRRVVPALVLALLPLAGCVWSPDLLGGIRPAGTPAPASPTPGQGTPHPGTVTTPAPSVDPTATASPASSTGPETSPSPAPSTAPASSPTPTPDPTGIATPEPAPSTAPASSPAPTPDPTGIATPEPSPSPAATVEPTPTPTPPPGPLAAWFSKTYEASDILNEPIARADPDNPAKRLAALIDTVVTTIEGAFYELEEPTVLDALARAAQRGVTVRLFTETDNYWADDTKEAPAAPVQNLLALGIPVGHEGRSALMHHKFLVADAATVWTGSFNLSESAAFKQNNNALQVASAELAANFRAEFEEIFTSRKFGKLSPKGVPNPIVTVGGATIETCFAPEDGCGDRIVAAVNAAARSVKFLAYSFTSDPIGQAMRDRAAAGIAVEGVFEKVGGTTTYSEYPAMKAAGLDVHLDGNQAFMHHKVILVDDELLITGSYNFSASADQDNEENVVFVRGAPEVAAAYAAEYARVKAAALRAGN